MKPLLLTIALLALYPSSTQAVKPVFITVTDGGCYVEDGQDEYKLKRLTTDDIQQLI